EQNPVSTIWITNTVEALDPAFVRRIDIVLEFRGAPTAARDSHLRSLPVTLPESTIRTISECTAVTPAVVSRAARVIELIGPALEKGTEGRVMERVVNETLKAQGHGCMRPCPTDASLYDTSC